MSGQDDPAAPVTALYRARADNDLDTVRDLLHPDVVWREPAGEAGYAGTHRGSDAVLNEMLGSTMEATAGTFQVDLEDVIAHGPCLAVALVGWSATRQGKEMAGREVAVYRVRDGQVVEASFQLEDPDATDAFFSG